MAAVWLSCNHDDVDREATGCDDRQLRDAAAAARLWWPRPYNNVVAGRTATVMDGCGEPVILAAACGWLSCGSRWGTVSGDTALATIGRGCCVVGMSTTATARKDAYGGSNLKT